MPPPCGDDLVGEVDGTAILWRRIVPNWIKSADDGTEFISSAAFRDNIDGNISVHIASLTTIQDILGAYPFCRLAEIDVEVIKECGFTLVPDPQPDDPSHAILRPPLNYRDKPKKSRIEDARKMARSARLLD